MFASTPASMSSFPATTKSSHANSSPTSSPGQNRHSICSPETHPSNRTSGSPLKVRKTRENLRTGFINDAAPTGRQSVPDLANSKYPNAQPLREIFNNAQDGAIRPSSRNTRFSWESNSIHLTTVIEQSPIKRTSSQSDQNEPRFAPSLSRKLSVRKRVVSKVKGGLLSRSKSSTKVPVRVDDDVAVSRSASEHERFAQGTINDGLQDMKEGHAIAARYLALDSVQSLVSPNSSMQDLGPILSTSPPPDLSTKKDLLGSDGSYPSPSREASPSPSPEKTPRPGRITRSSESHFDNTFKPLSMLHINLSVTPAYETLDLADEATMWAMIKAEASVSSDLPTNGMQSSASPQHAGKTQKPLNIIVIIDNSFVPSQPSLGPDTNAG
jgi:hypothetical protein